MCLNHTCLSEVLWTPLRARALSRRKWFPRCPTNRQWSCVARVWGGKGGACKATPSGTWEPMLDSPEVCVHIFPEREQVHFVFGVCNMQREIFLTFGGVILSQLRTNLNDWVCSWLLWKISTPLLWEHYGYCFSPNWDVAFDAERIGIILDHRTAHTAEHVRKTHSAKGNTTRRWHPQLHLVLPRCGSRIYALFLVGEFDIDERVFSSKIEGTRSVVIFWNCSTHFPSESKHINCSSYREMAQVVSVGKDDLAIHIFQLKWQNTFDTALWTNWHKYWCVYNMVGQGHFGHSGFCHWTFCQNFEIQGMLLDGRCHVEIEVVSWGKP